MTKTKRWEYEFIFILPPSLAEKEQGLLLKRIKKAISQEGGGTGDEENWGVKTLAYPLRKENKGRFFIWKVNFEKNPSLVKINLILNREKNLWRYLWIKGGKNG